MALINCGGQSTVKNKTPSQKPSTTNNNPAPTTSNPSQTPASGENKPGGYYLDDGPDANPPSNLDSIPSATPKIEPLLPRANKPYKALGQTYKPLSTNQDYKARGVASWYGKRFHGKKTSSGEIYDMYGMTAAHTTLPLPSYVKVTNPENGRSVIVRVNDRGPFKSNRIIDLSYAAAYQLRLISKGSGVVELEAIHPDQYNATNATPFTNSPKQTTPDIPTTAVKSNSVSTASATNSPQVDTTAQTAKPSTGDFFIQAGAFKSEANADALMKKIQGLEIEQNAGINRVYNNGIHRLKIGPYETKVDAERVAANIRKQLNISTIISNQ